RPTNANRRYCARNRDVRCKDAGKVDMICLLELRRGGGSRATIQQKPRICDRLTRRQADSALGKRVGKSSSPTHSGLILLRTICVLLLPNCSTHAFPCALPK